MTQPDATQLHDFIVDYFSLDELKTLCFKLGVEFDDLGGDGRVGKARELVLLMKRQTRLSRLDGLLLRARPEAYGRFFGRRIHEKTGIELIRIPAGSFIYGEGNDQKRVTLLEYWIGRAPVTNAQYKRFLDANPGHSVPFIYNTLFEPHNWDERSRTYPANKAEHPVVLISWDDAKAFCDWAGLALPSEEQWEKAARGTNGRTWPWGDEPPTARHCNFGHTIGDTTPVGKYAPQGSSPYGCVDMAGNVWDWTASWSRKGEELTLRGGSWGTSSVGVRAARREKSSGPHALGNHLGFRVVEPFFDLAS